MIYVLAIPVVLVIAFLIWLVYGMLQSDGAKRGGPSK